MTEINRSNLFGKLNAQLFRAAEAATVFCKLRGNPYVELVHWLHQLLQDQDSDLHRIIKHFGLDMSRIQADVSVELDRLPRGATAISDFSEHIDHAIERSWLYATLLYGDSVIRSGYLVVGMLKTTATLLSQSANRVGAAPTPMSTQVMVYGAATPRDDVIYGTPRKDIIDALEAAANGFEAVALKVEAIAVRES